jgi:general stress protein 26
MKKQENVEKLRELLKGSRICMLSTYNVSTGIHARPMAFNELTDDGEIYFSLTNTRQKQKKYLLTTR